MNDIEKISNHPVWDVYAQYRTARFNVHYYEKRLSILKRWNFTIESIIALSVPTIAGLWVWSTTIGSIFWQSLTALAAILAIVKPLLGLSNKIQENSEVLTKWRVLDGEFQKLTISISQYRRYDETMRDQFLKILETKTTITEPTEEPISTICKKCIEQVNRELPSEDFFIPEEE